MFCIENEYEDCIQSIHNQTHDNWEIFVIEKLANKEAHNKLYSTFMSRANEFDLFVKIDADMVLARKTFFEEIIEEVRKFSEVVHFQIEVWDHFTQRLITGLHIFRNTMIWPLNDEKYFVDVFNEKRVLKNVYKSPDNYLVPAAYHGSAPSEFQAFHFGVHKASKVMQIGNPVRSLEKAKWHLENVNRLLELYLEGRLLGNFFYALLGLVWAFENRITNKEVDFNDFTTNNAFHRLLKLPRNRQVSYVNKWLDQCPCRFSSPLFNNFLLYRYFFGYPLLLSWAKVYILRIKGRTYSL